MGQNFLDLLQFFRKSGKAEGLCHPPPPPSENSGFFPVCKFKTKTLYTVN